MTKTIQHKLLHALQAHADKTAIEYLGTDTTYADLDRQSDAVAGYLLQNGVGKGTFVGILLDHKADLITAILGVLKAGAVFVPLDSTYPLDRLRAMVASTDTRLLITEDCYLGLFPNADSVAFAQTIAPVVSPAQRPAGEYDPNGAVYVYFTSGTTGIPKAIIGRNKGLLHFVEWEIDTFSIASETRVSQFTSQCHDPYLRDIFVPLCAGGTICVPDSKETLLDPDQITAWIEASGVNLIHCTPSLFNQIAAGVQDAGQFAQLQWILMAGEKVVPRSLVNWYKLFGERIQLVNLYGPTETTLAKLYYLIQPSDVERDTIPLGKAIKGSRAIILDEQMKICGEGVSGEIYIRTPYLSLGYYNNDELNKAKFLVNPYTNDPNDLLYKTGDLGRVQSDGNIEFHGRIDRQIKIRGYRIEITEIENTLLQHDSVSEAVVVAKENANGDLFLCAYLVTADPSDTSQIALVKEYLISKLLDYMIPQQLLLLEQVPLTTNGKIDYNALPEPTKMEYAQPIGAVEQKLEEIWCEIFDVEQVSRHDRFFEMGGHSLNVMTLISRVYQEFDVELSLADVFQNLSLAELAQSISVANKQEYVAIEPVGHREYYALSSAQKSQFILSYVETDNLSYNAPKVIKINGPFDAERCEAIFKSLIERHETLRTSFEVVNGEPMQKIHEHVDFSMEILDGTARPVESYIRSFAQSFDLQKPPLLRVWLVKSSEQEQWLMFDMHHIISDGVSLSILLNEFLELYKGHRLEPLHLQYKDYCEWQTKFFASERFTQQEAFWLKTFGGEVASLEMPTDFLRPHKLTFEGKQVVFTLAPNLTNQLRKRVQETGATLNLFLLAIYNVFLYKYTGQEDITVGTASAGRPHPDLKNIIGMFVNTLGLRNYPTGSKRIVDLLEEVKHNAIQAYEHQDYPFEKLVERLQLHREQGRNPLFDTMFIMQNVEFPETTIDDITMTVQEIPSDTSKFDFKLDVFETGETITFTLEYNTNLFKAATVDRWVEAFLRITEAVLQDVQVKLSDIAIASLDEQQLMMDFAADF